MQCSSCCFGINVHLLTVITTYYMIPEWLSYDEACVSHVFSCARRQKINNDLYFQYEIINSKPR